MKERTGRGVKGPMGTTALHVVEPDESGDAFKACSYFSSLNKVCLPVLNPAYCSQGCHAPQHHPRPSPPLPSNLSWNLCGEGEPPEGLEEGGQTIVAEPNHFHYCAGIDRLIKLINSLSCTGTCIHHGHLPYMIHTRIEEFQLQCIIK